jgi:hypothetical protein
MQHNEHASQRFSYPAVSRLAPVGVSHHRQVFALGAVTLISMSGTSGLQIDRNVRDDVSRV